MPKEILLSSKVLPEKNFQKVAFFRVQKNVVQLTTFHQQITTTSPQNATQKITHFAETPCKTLLPPRAGIPKLHLEECSTHKTPS
jgi:hypothetical protein